MTDPSLDFVMATGDSDADELSFAQLYRAAKMAVENRDVLTFSAAEAQALLQVLDRLVDRDVTAYLLETQDPVTDEADDRAFVRASSAQFWADDDPADSVYDDLL